MDSTRVGGLRFYSSHHSISAELLFFTSRGYMAEWELCHPMVPRSPV